MKSNISTDARSVNSIAPDSGTIRNSCDQLHDLMAVIHEKSLDKNATGPQLCNLVGLALDLSSEILTMVVAVEAAEAEEEAAQ